MKTIRFFIPMILLAAFLPLSSYAQCYKDLPKEDLSDSEILSLKKMREEEMLAHDVYLYFSKSEAHHTSSIKELLVKYELDDPASEHETGKFTDPHMQEIYIKLVEQGKVSITEAFKAGLLIEDMDIADLDQALKKEIDNEDIAIVYGNLMKASKRHMKAFHFHASLTGFEYQPVYISESLYKEITGSE